MKKRPSVLFAIMILSMVLNPIPGMGESHPSGTGGTMMIRPGGDEAHISRLVDSLGGGDALYHEGLNGFDIYDYLGYVYMGWRTTGGAWQNHVIADFIMAELEKAGYQTTDADVEAPYGTRAASDKSASPEGDAAWLIRYQETPEKELGITWDPEYAALDIRMTTDDGAEADDPEARQLADSIGGSWWGYNPLTEVYQKGFAALFGMDYERDIAALTSDDERVRAMHAVLMHSDRDRDDKTGVEDYRFIARASMDKPNAEAALNKRTRLALESDFTDPAGTDPSEAKGSEGELIYVGNIDVSNNTNSEGVPNERIRGSVILTDASPYEGLVYALKNGGIGVATTSALEPYLHPKDEQGNVLEPWYDSSRYASGVGMEIRAQVDLPEDVKIVEWQFSLRQYDSARKLLARAKEADCKVMARQIAIGQTYPMTKTPGKPGQGQAVAIAEVKGSLHPDRRVLICAHVQEPGCCDNATGVASLLGIATQYKKMIDAGQLPRPKCTITFMWGDEMNMGAFWMDGHVEETSGLIGVLNMDMTGEDPDKTGGVMRIEKTPDPSAIYNYNLDAVPWNEPDLSIPSRLNPPHDENYRAPSGQFVRLPDSHTLWGATSIDGLFARGWYLNDLYMYAASTVRDRHDNSFRVEVCPFEGGSDHDIFLAMNIPALLTWHFTDYVYHTSSDTLYMASPAEMENVSLTTLATALMMSDTCDDESAAEELLDALKQAAMNRMDTEMVNTEHHLLFVKAGHATYTDALANEREVLNAWRRWYQEAFDSIATLVDAPSEALLTAIDAAKSEMDVKTDGCLAYAAQVLNPAQP